MPDDTDAGPDPEALDAAREALATAAGSADGDAADRITSIRSQLDDAGEAGRTLDHGRIARLQHSLSEVADAVEDPDPIREAKRELSAYREGVEGA